MILRVMALVVAALAGARVASAQTVPFSEISGLPKSDLAALQGKLTWLGSQDEMVPSVAFATAGTPVDPSVFGSAHTPGYGYGNDKMAPETFTASAAEIQALLDGVGAVAAVANGAGAATGGVLSLGLAAGGKVFEIVLSPADAASVLAAMLAALPSNPVALGHLVSIGCAGSLLDAPTASDATTSVTITRSGIRRSRASGRFVQTVTLENVSGGAIAGPISIVLAGLPGSVVVANKAGTTCKLPPPGRPYVSIVGSLAAGARSEVLVEFDNPDNLELAYTATVFSGGGPR